jgi:hypothetical protein
MMWLGNSIRSSNWLPIVYIVIGRIRPQLPSASRFNQETDLRTLAAMLNTQVFLHWAVSAATPFHPVVPEDVLLPSVFFTFHIFSFQKTMSSIFVFDFLDDVQYPLVI